MSQSFYKINYAVNFGETRFQKITFPFAHLESIGNVYAFLDLEHPAVMWAVMRGTLISARHASSSAGFISFMQAGMIAAGNNARIFNETVIEHHRATRFSDRISRLRGMYFFGSRQDAEARIGDTDWPSYFTKDNLVEFELLCEIMPTIVDANWITFAKTDETGRIPVDNLDWIKKYWDGEPYNKTPVWEVLADGVALISDEQLRRRCNDNLERQFPKAIIPILMARIASEVGTRGGLIHPFLLRENQETVRLAYLSSDAEFHDKDVLARMKEHPDSGKLAKLMFENETWHAPDLRPWGRSYQLSLRSLPQLDHVIPSVHDNSAASPPDNASGVPLAVDALRESSSVAPSS